MVVVLASQIHVSAVIFRDSAGRVLCVRKRGTEKFMFPGGKPEAGESAVDAAVREVAEELGSELDRECLTQLGVFEAPAANEEHHTVVATVFSYDGVVEPRPAAEIAECSWQRIDQPTVELAPLLKDCVFPALQC